MTEPKQTSPSTAIDPELQARHEAAKRVVFLTVFLDILGFGIIIPQLGVYAAQFGGAPQLIGVLAASYSAMQFLFTPFWGRLSDRIGRRPVLLWSIFGTAMGYVLFAFAQSLPWLFAARIIDGITGGNISTAQAYLSDVTPPQDRAKTFGLFGAIFGIGFAIGPLIGSLLSHLPGVWGGNLGIGVFTAALSLINWAMALKRLPETLDPATRDANLQCDASRGARRQLINIHGFQRAFAIPGLNRLILVSFFAMVAFATMQGTYTLYLIKSYVRPQIQQELRTNTPAALADVRHEMSLNKKTSVATASDTGEADSVGGDNVPFPAAMGGDFTLPQMPPTGLTWRSIEKILVRPRAARLAGWVFTVIGIVSLIVQGGLIGPLKKRLSEVNLILLGTLIMAAGLALVPAPREYYWEFPVMALLALGNGIASPVITSFVSMLAPDHERGEIMGVFQSVQSLGGIIGPVLGGFLFERIAAPAPYLAGGTIMLVSFALALGLRKAHPLGTVTVPREALAEAP